MRASYIAILVVLGVSSCAGGLVHSFNSFDAKPVAFTQDAWRKLQPDVESSNDPGCVLGGLAYGLKESRLLAQRQERFVFEQIGQPTKREGDDLVYSVGQCHGWGWHHSELVVQLSAERTVQKVYLRASRQLMSGIRLSYGGSVRPNPSLKRSANGRPPAPGCRYAVHCRHPGAGVLPSSSA